MVSQCVPLRPRNEFRHTALAALAGGDLVQLPNGRMAFKEGLGAAVAGQTVTLNDEGCVTIPATTGQVWIDGDDLYWDHSAEKATCVPPNGAAAGDKDCFLGTAVGDKTSAATTGLVNLNRRGEYIIDFHRDGGDTTVVLTAGTPYLVSRGGTMEAGFSATAEAQKLDWLSKRSFPIASKWVLEAIVEIQTNCDADVGDLSILVANASHASDAEAITEFAGFHFDMGADLNLDACSDDGTTDVDPTDTTLDWAVGTPIHLKIDGRDPTDIQMYVNGVLVLGATVFTLTAATGPLKALFHLEKSSNDSPGVVQLDMLRVRIQGE